MKKIFRRLRTLLWTALTLLTVLAAVIVGIGKLLMPYSVHYQPELEAWLSEAFNQPVKVESFNGEWKAFGPRISLQGLTLMPEGLQSEIAIKTAALDIKPLNALIPGRPLYSFRIIGADLSLERATDGRYVLSGLGVSDTSGGQESNAGLRDVVLNGEVSLQDISLSFDDPERDIHLLLNDVNGRFKANGRRLAAEIKARVTDKGGVRVIGDLDAIVRVRLDSNQRLREASWHVETGELLLTDLIPQLPHHPLIPVSGRLNAEVWGQWQRGEPQQMQGVLDLRDAQLSSQTGPLVVDHLNSRFNFEFTHRKNWRADMAGLTVGYAGEEWQSDRFSVARNLPQNLGLWVSADYAELEYPLQLTQRIMANYGKQWPLSVPRRAQGGVTDFDLVLDGRWQLKKLTGELRDGYFWGWEKGPDVEGLSATLALDSGEGNVSLEGTAIKLDWLRAFRRPLVFSMTDCQMEVIWKDKHDWGLDLNRCIAENDDLSASGRVRLAFGQGKPTVDINVALERGEVSRFRDYWPQNVMTQKTIQWLRKSLVSGRVSNGRYTMVGDMDDFPFKDQGGKVQAIASFNGVEINYFDGWPRASGADGVVEFDGPGMNVEARVENIAGAVVDKMTGSIADFKNPVLDLNYQTATKLPSLIGFIKQTPLLDGLELDPEQFVFDGEAELSGHLHSRLGGSEEPIQVTGALTMKGNRFTDLVSDVVLEDIEGVLNYSHEGLKAVELPANFRGYPVLVDIISQWDADEVFRMWLRGDLPVAEVVPQVLFEREPLFHRATGTSRWDVSLRVVTPEGGGDRETWLDLFSNLEGVSIDMPAPLAKPAEPGWPLLVRYPVKAEQHILTADFIDRMQLKMELSREDYSPIRAAVRLGGKAESLPDPGLFKVSGSTPDFDLDNWIDLVVDRFADAEEDDGLSLQNADLYAERVKIFDRQFDAVELGMRFENGVITGNFDSQDINGVVNYYKNESDSHSMSGEFERLIVPDALAEGLTMESDPAELPEIHFYSREFNYLGVDMGETRIEGYPVSNGFHIESVEAQSPRFNFNARGDWYRTDAGERSDFDIRITSESLGAVLEAMDISSAMQGGQTMVHFDAWWEGPPAAFALERLNGEIDISVVRGNILTADSGAGRMLGLFSLTELPRRLAMDFRDVFDEGFSFDEARGTMRLENGTSHTDDMVLTSTVAEISITGSADLVEQTFDYEFAVRPGVSKTLPVIGAIAGGPVGAAAGLALQAILRDALGEAAEARYTIGGTWEEPVIEPVAKPSKSSGGNDTPQSDAAAPGADQQQDPEQGKGLESETAPQPETVLEAETEPETLKEPEAEPDGDGTGQPTTRETIPDD
ncbi:MAG: TIGR02099 family protein [Xanthomonadales bacterium]|nr:TIGR02099 family protein [Xanthomonadales bacterium]